ncbi:MAG: hypothetical protein KIT58_06825 [Planctomycetota bacterium]|nr:hypothetical protein [Planctomycetota bacterium]
MSLRLEIHTPTGVFSLAVAGGFEPRLEPVWKEAAEPPEVVEVREVWEVPGVRLVASDGEPATLWREWTEFLARFRVRGAGAPVTVRLVRDPAGAAEVVWTLGPPTHERFRVEHLGAGREDHVPRAAWRVLAPFTLVVSAVQRFADARGIVGWDQETSSRFDGGGLQTVEWRTTITTREGTSAVDKARRFGRIDRAPFGPSYAYDTNGPDGVEVTTNDADELGARVPTRAVAVSRIRQWGVPVGAGPPGTTPTEVGYSVRTLVEKGETTTTLRATARGPGALAWVEARRPGGAVDTSEVFCEEALRYAEATWTLKGEAPQAPRALRWQLHTELTGGHPDVDMEPVVGGYEPVLFEGAVLPWRLTVHVRARRRGGEGTPDELPLPGLLPTPWVLDRGASREQEPHVEEDADDAAARLWAREATLVYLAARRPTTSPIRELEGLPPVPSHYLGAVP